jgi:hypothetical protein
MTNLMMKKIDEDHSNENHELWLYSKAQGVPKIALIFTQNILVNECPRQNTIRQHHT